MRGEPSVYDKGNPWQKKVYKKMAEFIASIPEIDSFGQTSKGSIYKHLLPEKYSKFNFINNDIYLGTEERFRRHKAGDRNRVMTNMAASQPYCFNLIIFLKSNLPLASNLFSQLLNRKVEVKHLEPEFTPNTCEAISEFEPSLDESIGDQNIEFGYGTDADIAVFYTYENSKKGVLLIEFKFIESEFSICSSFAKKKFIQPVCNSSTFFNELIVSKKTYQANKFYCGYNKYLNWSLTKNSKVIDVEKVKLLESCPFKSGLNQLWRNMLLAEQVSIARKCNDFGFWVFSPVENDQYLWRNGQIETQFREILSKEGNDCFKKVYLETILDYLKDMCSSHADQIWHLAMEAKYRIS